MAMEAGNLLPMPEVHDLTLCSRLRFATECTVDAALGLDGVDSLRLVETEYALIGLSVGC